MTKLEMMLMRPGTDERMKHIEGEIAKTVHPYRENTEAAIVVFALFRVARLLLRLYPRSVQKTLLDEVLVPFLRDGEATATGDTGRLISLN